MITEAIITIGGRQLTNAQSLTLRVAIGGFLMDLADPSQMDALGPIGPLYQQRANEIQFLLMQSIELQR